VLREASQGEYNNHLLNVKVLEGWDYRVVDLGLVEAKGDVNSGALGSNGMLCGLLAFYLFNKGQVSS